MAFHLVDVTGRMSRDQMSPGGCHWANGRVVLAALHSKKKHGIPPNERHWANGHVTVNNVCTLRLMSVIGWAVVSC